MPGFAWFDAVFYHGPHAQGSGSRDFSLLFLVVLGELGRLKSRVPSVKAPWGVGASRYKSEQQRETSRRCLLAWVVGICKLGRSSVCFARALGVRERRASDFESSRSLALECQKSKHHVRPRNRESEVEAGTMYVQDVRRICTMYSTELTGV